MPAMPYDFDTPVDRHGTSSLKWDYGARIAGREGLLPLWVADMDFRAPPEIQDAVRRRAEHPVFGYTLEPDSYFEAAAAWLARRHGWPVEREWMLSSPGVVAALTAAILALTVEGDGVIVQPPVYYPFERKVEATGRRVLRNPLRLEGGRYRMDLEHFERLAAGGAKALILCSPHNPVGRVWEPVELAELAALCLRHGIVVIADEIHHDLVMPGHRHTPLATLPGAAAVTVTLTSVTKTFNLAGLSSSLTIVPDPRLRSRIARSQSTLWPGIANAMSVVAAEAAWRHGERWLDELVAYVAGNWAVLRGALAERLTAASLTPLEGTYLAWMDLRALGLDDAEVTRRIRAGGVWLDEGRKFGAGGEGFQRMNLACPRSVLSRAIDGVVASLAGG